MALRVTSDIDNGFASVLLAALGAVSSVVWLLASPIAATRELAVEVDL